MRDGRTLHNLKAKKLKADGQSNPKEASKIIQRDKALAKRLHGRTTVSNQSSNTASTPQQVVPTKPTTKDANPAAKALKTVPKPGGRDPPSNAASTHQQVVLPKPTPKDATEPWPKESYRPCVKAGVAATEEGMTATEVAGTPIVTVTVGVKCGVPRTYCVTKGGR
jgi:hypothetical protein